MVGPPTANDRLRASQMGIAEDMQGEGLWDIVKHVGHAVKHGADFIENKMHEGIEGVKHLAVDAKEAVGEELHKVGQFAKTHAKQFEKFAADSAMKGVQGLIETGLNELAPGLGYAAHRPLGFVEKKLEGKMNSWIDGQGYKGGGLLLPGAGMGGYSKPSHSYVPHIDRHKFHPNQLKRLP